MSPLVTTQVLLENKEKRSSRSLSKFQVYENSVSDAWETEVLENEKVTTSSVKVFIASKVEENVEEVIMPPVSAPNHRNSRVQALQRLAIQREPLPSLSVTTPSSSKATLNTLPEVSGITPRLAFRHLTTGPSADQNRFSRLRKLFTCEISSKTTHATGDVDLERLREDCWMGIPHRLRPYAWRILSGYVPTCAAERQSTVNQKRSSYWEFVTEHYPKRLEEEHSQTFRQIHIDIPRMCPLIPLFQQDVVQEIFERILFIWAIQHPESGYVQGINDLVTPFFVVYLSEFIPADIELGSFQVSQLPLEQLQLIEADCFFCIRSLLHSIEDNYILEQPGIQRKVKELESLTSRVDKTLHDHLISNGIEFLQFSFRWMNNILMREIPLRATIRLWDTYLCEPDGFSQFHNYVCSAFLRKWSRQIQMEKDFQGIIIFLQNLPTQSWGDREICELTADAYSLMSVFDGARRHFQSPVCL